ncbi:MAG: hypothetical protein ACI9OF_002712, partial [Saprospiraceae bacterium]
ALVQARLTLQTLWLILLGVRVRLRRQNTTLKRY